MVKWRAQIIGKFNFAKLRREKQKFRSSLAPRFISQPGWILVKKNQHALNTIYTWIDKRYGDGKNGLSGGNSRQSAILIEPTVSRNHAGNPFLRVPRGGG